MATCDITGICGTGNWNGPKPGDPNMNTINITATAAFGGIDVRVSWPTVNPSAVAHTKLFRGLLPDFTSAVQHAIFQGDFFFDASNPAVSVDTRYYYWAQMVSINGTEGDVVGPATATAKPLLGDYITLLTGEIDAGMLSQSLKTEIDQITLNKLGITQEEIDRAANDDGLAVAINELRAESAHGQAVLQEEIRLRTDGDSSLAQTVNTMYTDFNGNIAAIQQEQTALASDVAALASNMTTVQVQLNGDSASGQVGLVAEVNTINGNVTQIGARWTAIVQVNGLIGGFGVYNNGQTVEAGFDVDRFWIGRTGANGRKPFIVDGSTVYIDDAAIRSLTIDKMRSTDGSLVFINGKLQAQYIAVDQLSLNNVQSNNYVPGTSGWAMNSNGTMEINGSSGTGRMIISQSAIKVFDQNGVLRVQLGNLWV